MGLFVDHLLNGSYPYLTPAEFIERCPAAAGADVTDDDVLDAVEDASLIVYYLTGRQFNGTTQTTISPDCYGADCGPYKISLGLWPVTDIIAVREEGVDQDPLDYHIDEYRYLIKNNGEAFPHCGNQYAEAGSTYDSDTERGGWVFNVTIEHGIPAPRLIKRATRALACSLYADSVGSDECQLPERVTNVTRQGVTMEIQDFTALLDKGSTGIYEVDLAVRVLNPSGLQSPTFIWTPDMHRGTRRNQDVGYYG
jgi:hypothetical protein